MKAVLKFDLSDPDDVMDYYRHNKSLDMALCLSSIADLWRRWKHAEKEPTSEEVFEAIREIISDSDLDLNKLIQ
jgi:hypothetical protein